MYIHFAFDKRYRYLNGHRNPVTVGLFFTSTFLMLQLRQQTADKSECGDDWCALNRETNIKLESFEKRSEELQV